MDPPSVGDSCDPPIAKFMYKSDLHEPTSYQTASAVDLWLLFVR